MTPLQSISPGLVLLLALLPALLATPAVPATPTQLGNWFAWLGSGFVSTSLLLTIGAPRFAQQFGGFERMYRWHHAIGTAGYVALLVHPLALTAPSLSIDPASARLLLVSTTQSTVGIVGWLALFGFIVGLVGTCVIPASHILWRRLHTALAAFVVLGVVHIVASDGLSASAVAVIAPAAVALGWRLWRAARETKAPPGNTRAAPVLEIVSVTTKVLVFGSTCIFLLAVTALWIGTNTTANGGEQIYTLNDVARHDNARDCWMAIDGTVYDLTSYLPQHPTPSDVIVPSCGADATVAYHTKNRGRPHSPYADQLLTKHRIGVLKK